MAASSPTLLADMAQAHGIHRVLWATIRALESAFADLLDQEITEYGDSLGVP